MFWGNRSGNKKRRDNIDRAIPRLGRSPHTSLVQKIILWTLALTLIVVGLLAGGRSSELQVQSITVREPGSLDPDTITDVAETYIEGTYIWLIPKSHILLISKRRWEQHILKHFPILKRATISFPEKAHVAIDVEEREPSYVWCPGERDTTLCYFSDISGVVFERAPEFSRGVYLVFRQGDLADHPDPFLRTFASGEVLEYGTLMVQSLKEREIVTDEISLLSHGDITFTLSSLRGSLLSVNTEIRTNQEILLEQTLHTLDLLLQDRTFTSSFNAYPRDLEYIDLRFPGKIIYKFSKTIESVSDEPLPENPEPE